MTSERQPAVDVAAMKEEKGAMSLRLWCPLETGNSNKTETLPERNQPYRHLDLIPVRPEMHL